MGYRFAIIGCGHIGRRHAEHISNLATLVAVCDCIPEKADALAADFKCMAFYSITDLMDSGLEIDILSVCSPNYLHEAHSIAGLEAGAHVICEKPMAIHTESCERMIDSAEKTGKQVFVVKQNRYNPPVQAVKELMKQKRLGRILMANLNCFWNRDETYYRESDWKGIKEKDGGILFTQFSHFIDVLVYLLGPLKVSAGTGANLIHHGITDFEDNLCFILEGREQLLVGFNASTCAFGKNMEGSLTIIGESGTVKIGGQYLNTIEYSNIRDITMEPVTILQNNNQYGHYEGSMSNHRQVIQNVIDTLDGKTVAMTSASEGSYVVQLIEEMYSAIKNS